MLHFKIKLDIMSIYYSIAKIPLLHGEIVSTMDEKYPEGNNINHIQFIWKQHALMITPICLLYCWATSVQVSLRQLTVTQSS